MFELIHPWFQNFHGVFDHPPKPETMAKDPGGKQPSGYSTAKSPPRIPFRPKLSLFDAALACSPKILTHSKLPIGQALDCQLAQTAIRKGLLAYVAIGLTEGAISGALNPTIRLF